tara:strand:- start:265 stop:1038 length:774 start_codon:yes stop_codon:yes gene_type:complete
MNCFAFDIETIPDVEFGRKMWNLEGLSDEDIGNTMMFKQKQKTNSEFLPLHQHKIVAISVALRNKDTFKVWSLGDEEAPESEIVQRFFDGIQKYTPDLLSWNGVGFDLPVLHYRALKHKIQAPKYWDSGKIDNNFRYNNYLSRFHARHIDLMDVISGYQMKARASLDQIAIMLGYPGKLGMSGNKVWPCWLKGEITAIRNYCETDVINTYLVYLSFEFMRGNLTESALQEEFNLVRASLASDNHDHLNEFLSAWAET